MHIFQDQWHQAHVSDFVFRKRFADEFRPKRAQMDDARSAGERAEKTDHEIDGMICRKNDEVATAWPKRIERGEGDALFEIIFMHHHAALGTAACTGRLDEPAD